MNNEELIETLRNFTEQQVSELPDKAKMVFYAIMDIADQRDKLQERINKTIKIIENALEIIEQCSYVNTYYQDKNLMGHTCDKQYTEKKIKDLLKILKGEQE